MAAAICESFPDFIKMTEEVNWFAIVLVRIYQLTKPGLSIV